MWAARSLFCVLMTITAMCSGQAAPSGKAGHEQEPAPEPEITQIRKSVTFIKLMCNDGSRELDVRGTGFFIGYPDPRLGQDGAFSYLVTNRHVALCVNDSGHAMRVDRISIRLNRPQANGGTLSEEIALNEHGNIQWVVPEDSSVDLAVFPLLPDARFDFKLLSVTMLATKDLLAKEGITEGEPVFFAGFFYQFPGTKRMQPIVRQGIIAMMPDEKIPFVGIPEKLYLADVHAFGGNSGAPAFINLGGFHHGTMVLVEDYRVLGVVNGEILEDENFDLQLATTFRGVARANSGVSTIVPADYLKALLEGPRLQRMRDEVVKTKQAGK